jgi:uncharacterized protein
MAGNYKTPGVYVEEISTIPPSIAQVETAIPAFIGYTQIAEKDGIDIIKKPTRISSLTEYERYFGTVDPLNSNASITAFSITVTITIDDDGTKKAIRKIVPVLNPASTIFRMYYSLKLFFDNGGGPCYIVSAGKTDTVNISNAYTDFNNALTPLKFEDEPTLILFPDAHLITTDTNYYNNLYNNALTQSKDLGDRFTIIDVRSQALQSNDIPNLRNASLGNLKYGAVYYPNLKTTLSHIYDDSKVNVVEKIVNSGGTETTKPTVTLNNKSSLTLADFEYNAIKAEIRRLIRVILPPGSAMAGVYARVDRDRGVWKAPANVTLSSVIEPTIKISDEEQEGLNVDTNAGKSVNVIRFFRGKGVLVWGARTLAGNDNEWRYVSVRRFYNMVEESVKKSTFWVVFEPNDANTWVKVRSMIENYLITLWRQGALAGSKPEEAFFVKVGLGETMTSLDILEGRMNVEIGMAVVRPAEFIILKFSHKLQES